jgi:hypothetical protein
LRVAIWAGGLIAAVLAVGPAAAQVKDSKQGTYKGETVIEHADGVKKAPLPYKQLDLKHPETGKPVKPTDMIKLPDGKQMKAGDFYSWLNSLEKNLVKIGSSVLSLQKKTEAVYKSKFKARSRNYYKAKMEQIVNQIKAAHKGKALRVSVHYSVAERAKRHKAVLDHAAQLAKKR